MKKLTHSPRFRIAAVALFALSTVSCVPEIAVVLETRLYRDGSLDRRIEITGWDSEGKVPTDAGWLENSAGITLASPEDWNRVESSPGFLSAEGFFTSTDLVPGTLRHVDENLSSADRNRIALATEDLVVLTLRIYRETYGDPYGSEDAARAIHELLDLLLAGLRDELRRSFGDRVDAEPLESLFHNDIHRMATDLLEVNRSAPGPDEQAERERLWTEILTNNGIRTGSIEPDAFWDDNAAPLVAWLGHEIASALSTAEEPIGREDLDFWPEPGDPEGMERLLEIAARAAGGEEEFNRLLEPLIANVLGHYATEFNGPTYRFTARVAVPGTLLSTNGTPTGEGIVWFFRAEDLSYGDRLMEAVTAEPNPDSIRALGARRDLEPDILLRIVDLLTERDPEGQLKVLLADAVRKRRIDLLREENSVPEGMRRRARELADLLDPESVDHPSRR